MRLTDLEPEWVYHFDPAKHGFRRADDAHCHITHGHCSDDPDNGLVSDLPSIDLAQAQGVMFLCPTCFKKNGGAVGTESVLVWFKDRGVPPEAFPGPGRWTVSGTNFEDLTLNPSVNVDHEHWHGWIKNGEVT